MSDGELNSDGDPYSEWVADIYHNGKRLRFRGCGPGEESLNFSLTPVRHEHGYSTLVDAHLHGRCVEYVDAPPERSGWRGLGFDRDRPARRARQGHGRYDPLAEGCAPLSDSSHFIGQWAPSPQEQLAFELWESYFKETELYDRSIGCPIHPVFRVAMPASPWQHAASTRFALGKRAEIERIAMAAGIDEATMKSARRMALDHEEAR
ncbi:MAG: hypothetical protein ABL998_00855 [Planctomycetota bacterium]